MNSPRAASTLTRPESIAGDQREASLRPARMDEFIGQRNICRNLKTFIKAAAHKGAALDHVLLAGPPGLGKTTLAQIIAHELGTRFHMTSGAVIARAGELAALLTNLKERDVLFIDEIHRLNKTIEEVLYPALEDGKLDLMVGEGPAARSVRLSLAPFTLIGATTRQGLLSRPLRDRFGILGQMSFYEPPDLTLILDKAARKLNVTFDEDAALYLANRGRGTPRIVLRLLRRISDFALVQQQTTLTVPFLEKTLSALGVDQGGLDALDRRYIHALAHQFGGGPVGIDTLASLLFEEKHTLEDIVEPFLMQQGFIKRTPRGRVLEAAAYDHLGLPAPEVVP